MTVNAEAHGRSCRNRTKPLIWSREIGAKSPRDLDERCRSGDEPIVAIVITILKRHVNAWTPFVVEMEGPGGEPSLG